MSAVGRTRMRTVIIMLVAAASMALAQDQPPPRIGPIRDTMLTLDHVVANVGDRIITQSDLQERLIAMRQSSSNKLSLRCRISGELSQSRESQPKRDISSLVRCSPLSIVRTNQSPSLR